MFNPAHDVMKWPGHLKASAAGEYAQTRKNTIAGPHSALLNAENVQRAAPVRVNYMLISEEVAQSKWCPMVRVEGSNRVYNTKSDGYDDAAKMYHCIASRCMSWREFHLSHLKGGYTEPTARHGYCGLAGRPELE